MTDAEEISYINIIDGIKSVPISRIEQCIAAAIAKEIGVSAAELDCEISKLDVSGRNSVGIRLSVLNNYDDEVY